MHFKHFDSLRVFTIVAEHGSFAAAAEPLNLTKGAVSHQIRLLESSLGFDLFQRKPRGVLLTNKGEQLLSASSVSFTNLENVIHELQSAEIAQLTLGVTTYFASRWLSQKLMTFMQQHPDMRLRLQPMIDLTNLQGEGIDLAIRWGNGDWPEQETTLLFSCPAWPSGSATAYKLVQELGEVEAFSRLTLLHDHQQSEAWQQWFNAAGLELPQRADTLIIPDPNVRVEALIDNQGIALNDALVERELASERLFRLSEVELSDYGYYLVYNTETMSNPVAEAFSKWILSVAQD